MEGCAAGPYMLGQEVWSFPLGRGDDPIPAEIGLWELMEDGDTGGGGGEQQNSWEAWRLASRCANAHVSVQARVQLPSHLPSLPAGPGAMASSLPPKSPTPAGTFVWGPFGSPGSLH